MTPSEFEQVFFAGLTPSTFIKIFKVAKAATGKMYKRCTFDNLALPLRSRFGGIVRNVEMIHDEKGKKNTLPLAYGSP